MWSLVSSRIVRCCLAFTLSLWVAGIGCIFGCEGRGAAAANRTSYEGRQDESTSIISEHSCSSANSHSCCAKKAERQAAHRAQNGSSKETTAEPVGNGASEIAAPTLISTNDSRSGVKECPFAGSRIAIAAKGQNTVVAAAPAIAHSNFFSGPSLEPNLNWVSPLRLPNRGHTYLRCCVFLI